MAGNSWRSQSVWLKLLLLVSVALVAIGMYRCSMELAPQAKTGEPHGETSGRGGPAEAP